MRHRVKKIKLSRDYDHRRAVIKNLIKSFFKRGKIESTKAKINVTQRAIERLISKGIKAELNAYREFFKIFQDQKRVNELVKNILPQLKGKKSGFTKVRRVGVKKGDGSIIYRLEFSQPVSLEVEKTKEKKKQLKEKKVKKRKKTK